MEGPGPSWPYLPNTPSDRQEMLRAIGVSSVEDLFADIPDELLNPALQLPTPAAELDVRREVEALARQNASPGGYSYFLGGGAYRHFIPSLVGRITSRGELATCYTPYQPEVSQGTLQATYEFQSLVCGLTAMDVANAGMYDGATALAEAVLMACRVTGRDRAIALDTLSPRYKRVIETYVRPQGITVDMVPFTVPEVPDDAACLVAQYPNFLGNIEDLAFLERKAHEKKALLVVSVDPIALGLFKSPGEYAADVVTGECQPLGIGLSFGGPYVGLFACRERYVRQMPGRIVGRTTDSQGRTGYVLTLQTREQHIRRERATSNICTSEALVATSAAIYLAALGRQGLRRVAELCYHKAHYAASLIREVPGYKLPFQAPFFKEFIVQVPAPVKEINRRLLDRKIIGGLDISDLVPNGMLLCVTEMNTKEEIHALRDALAWAAREAR
ncbi:MAG: aminomethyl-transferring glycine dehydrogenase subunit GcvPA [Chloroflexi bacterium]|nr:aminomethyl-transferring glycine dehydrogenase subunit GcvPA [Chloroflexota bacterium]